MQNIGLIFPSFCSATAGPNPTLFLGGGGGLFQTKLLLGPTFPLFPAHGDVQNNHHLRSISRQQEEKLQSSSRENAPTFLRFLFQRSTDRLTVLFARTGKASKSQPVKPSTKKKKNPQENHIFPRCGARDPYKQRSPCRCAPVKHSVLRAFTADAPLPSKRAGPKISICKHSSWLCLQG